MLMETYPLSSSNQEETFDYQQKKEYRERILTVASDNCIHKNNDKILTKVLEPIALEAESLEQITKFYPEENIIGITYNKMDETSSDKIINSCREKYPKATYFKMDWAIFCNSYDKGDIELIHYDLFTCGHGKNFKDNMIATLRLVKRCKQKLGHVTLVVNNDLSALKRKNKEEKDLQTNLETLINDVFENTHHSICEKPYTYKNKSRGHLMGAYILEFV
jgi:hypothetical protein